MLEQYHIEYEEMPEDVKGITLQTPRKRRRDEIDMPYSSGLQELYESARNW